MMDSHVLDMIGEDEEAYEAAKARHKKKLKEILAVSAMVHMIAGEDAFYNKDNYDEWEDEIYND